MYSHNDRGTMFNPVKDYFWQGQAMGMHAETARADIESLCPGLDCAINCHQGLINVQKSVPDYDDVRLRRHRDPGAGAFTPYHNGTTGVSRKIPVGGELFKDYGASWFVYRNNIFGLLPMAKNYRLAENLLRKLLKLRIVQRHLHTNTDEQPSSLEPVLLQDFYGLITGDINSGPFESRTLNAWPATLQEALRAAQSEDGLATLLQPQHTRDLDWLEAHGTCIDHIAPGWSTLPQAGHGAFATRPLEQGKVITSSPLHHFPDYAFMNMYHLLEENSTAADDDDDEDEDGSESHRWYRMRDQIEKMQLYYNYCYGVSDSTLLLCPYGAGISYINHNQSQANVRVEWADPAHLMVHNRTAVEVGTLDDLSVSPRPQLGFQYVATRDIIAGEELFLDYGDAWERAWNEHAAQYPRRVAARRHRSTRRRTTGTTNLARWPCGRPTNKSWIPTRTICRFGATVPCCKRPIAKPSTFGGPSITAFRVLSSIVLSRSGGKARDLYTVKCEWDEDEDNVVTWFTRTDVPRSALRFFDMPYTTDLQQPTAFRHEIGIPDEIFPDRWRNLDEDFD